MVFFRPTHFFALLVSVVAAGSHVLATDDSGQRPVGYIQQVLFRFLRGKFEHQIGFSIPDHTFELSAKDEQIYSGNGGRKLSSREYTFTPCDNAEHPCDTVIARYSVVELKAMIDASFSSIVNTPECLDSFPTCGVDRRADRCKCIHDSMCLLDRFCLLEICPEMCYDMMLEPLIASMIQNGVEVRKICSSCDEESSLGNTPFDSDGIGYCTGYGRNATVSGLLVSPTDAETGQNILPGSLTAHIHSPTFGMTTCSGASRFTPDRPVEYSDHSALMAIAMASLGRVTLVPDYLGFEESYNFFKGFAIKKHYQTSTMPLWMKAKRILAKETSCMSKVSNNVILSGYSAGGYGAVAAAEALQSYGAKIIKLLAGGAPLRYSSTQMLHAYRSFLEGTNPMYIPILLSMTGQSFSSTVTGPENYQTGQDLLADNWIIDNVTYTKHDIVNITTASTNFREVFDGVFPQGNSRISIWNSDMIDFISGAIRDGDMEPCKNSARVAEAAAAGKPVDKLCEALRSNDLDNFLRNVSVLDRFPFELCHSDDDDAVPIENVLEFLDRLYSIEGVNHMAAGIMCLKRIAEVVSVDEFSTGLVSEETGEVVDSSQSACGEMQDEFLVIKSGEEKNEVDDEGEKRGGDEKEVDVSLAGDHAVAENNAGVIDEALLGNGYDHDDSDKRSAEVEEKSGDPVVAMGVTQTTSNPGSKQSSRVAVLALPLAIIIVPIM